MQLTFDSLFELDAFLKYIGLVREEADGEIRTSINMSSGPAKLWRDPVPDDNTLVVPLGSGVVTYGGGGGGGAAEQSDSEQPTTRRKRRTKAEVEADKAAQDAAAGLQPVLSATTAAAEIAQAVQHSASQANPLDNLKSEPSDAPDGDAWAWAREKMIEQAALFDGNDKLAHLNEGRSFIEAHGFPSYNDTLQLADVPANIANHTPEQVSRHRSAMAWMAANKTKKG